MVFYRKCCFYLPSLTNTGYSKCDVNTNNSVNALLKKTASTYWWQFFNLSLEYENVIYLPIDTYSWVIRVLYELLLYSSRSFAIGFTRSEFYPVKPKIMDIKCCWPRAFHILVSWLSSGCDFISNCSHFFTGKRGQLALFWLFFSFFIHNKTSAPSNC